MITLCQIDTRLASVLISKDEFDEPSLPWLSHYPRSVNILNLGDPSPGAQFGAYSRKRLPLLSPLPKS